MVDNLECLGYDCDGNEIEEFRVLRFPFSMEIDDWDLEPNVDPRFYCLVRSSNGNVHGISIYDDWHKKYIRRYEGILENDEIPTIIKSLEELSNYEVAYSGIDGKAWFYDRDRNELRKDLDKILNIKKRVRKNKL